MSSVSHCADQKLWPKLNQQRGKCILTRTALTLAPDAAKPCDPGLWSVHLSRQAFPRGEFLVTLLFSSSGHTSGAQNFVFPRRGPFNPLFFSGSRYAKAMFSKTSYLCTLGYCGHNEFNTRPSRCTRSLNSLVSIPQYRPVHAPPLIRLEAISPRRAINLTPVLFCQHCCDSVVRLSLDPHPAQNLDPSHIVPDPALRVSVFEPTL